MQTEVLLQGEGAMNNYCARCGGIFSKDMTVHEDGDKRYHYYCSWKIWKEKQEALAKESEKIATVPKS